MKNISRSFLIFIASISFISLSYSQPAEIWVSPDGADANPGTQEEPFKSILMAQRKAREMRRLNDATITKGISIVLKNGSYALDETLLLRPEDSGTESSPTLFTAEQGANPTISGGVPVSGWQLLEAKLPGLPAEAEGKIWVSEVPEVGGKRLEFRQLWVNNKKAVRASTLNDGELDRIISVDNANETFMIPDPKLPPKQIGQLEFVIHQWWAIAILRVKNIDIDGDQAKISFHQPESRIEFEHPWPAPFIDEFKELNGNSAFYLANSISLLNSPGEWYQDLNSGKLYYWPREGENLNEAEVIAPYLETLVSIEGTLDNPVTHVSFEGINFAHTSWMRPSLAGHVPLQAGMYIYDAYKLKEPGTPDKSSLENQAWIGRQSAGVSVSSAYEISFGGCKFEHMAATGLDFIYGASQSKVEGCIFTDIGGTGIQIGFFGDKNFETHLPYDPTDKRELCRFITISNNLITNVTNEDWGCVGISAGYVHDINIEHNEVSHINYSGICVGWGWTKTITCLKNNRVHANYIHHFARNMFDVGGVYTLSAQPNTEVSENRIERLLKAPYAHIPEHFQYIYFDEGTSNVRALNNWVEKAIFFENNPGHGNIWLNNNSQVDDTIRQKAGLKDEYKYLQKIYEEESLSQVLKEDAEHKTVEYEENHLFLEDGRGPR